MYLRYKIESDGIACRHHLSQQDCSRIPGVPGMRFFFVAILNFHRLFSFYSCCGYILEQGRACSGHEIDREGTAILQHYRQNAQQWKHLLLTYKFALDEMSTKLMILNEEFQFVHDYNPIEHIKTRLKTPESIVDKLRRKGFEVNLGNARAHIHDIAGVRVICSFSTDIYRIYEMICAQSDVTIVQVKDYVRQPKPNGYQSLHMIVEIPVFLTDRMESVKVEIQIRTMAMDFWASLEHKIYYKYNANVPASIRRQLKEAADTIASLDEQMLSLNEEVQQYRPDSDRTGGRPDIPFELLTSGDNGS